jgi:hypothetical protein
LFNKFNGGDEEDASSLLGIVSIKIKKMREKAANKIVSKTENPKYF